MVNDATTAVNAPAQKVVTAHAPVAPLSQAAIGRALGISPANMTKLKGKGMPVDSVETARQWREQRQNIAARKRDPLGGAAVVGQAGAAVPVVPALGGAPGAAAKPAANKKTAPAVPVVLVGSGVVAAGPGGASGGAVDAAGDGGEGGLISSEAHWSARTRREVAEANLAEMREAEERGDLIRIDVVKSTLAVVFATTRDGMLQLPARLAPLLAAESDPAAVQGMLHTEIHQALQQLAGAADRLGSASGAAA